MKLQQENRASGVYDQVNVVVTTNPTFRYQFPPGTPTHRIVALQAGAFCIIHGKDTWYDIPMAPGPYEGEAGAISRMKAEYPDALSYHVVWFREQWYTHRGYYAIYVPSGESKYTLEFKLGGEG